MAILPSGSCRLVKINVHILETGCRRAVRKGPHFAGVLAIRAKSYGPERARLARSPMAFS